MKAVVGSSVLITVTLVSCGGTIDPAGDVDVRKPNILFVMSDDHTYQAIGAYGSRLAKLNPTPTIDSLASNGMRFGAVRQP